MLYKTTIVIWSDTNPGNATLGDLAYEATEGNSYCSRQETETVAEPEADPQWDGTEFFVTDDEGEAI